MKLCKRVLALILTICLFVGMTFIAGLGSKAADSDLLDIASNSLIYTAPPLCALLDKELEKSDYSARFGDNIVGNSDGIQGLIITPKSVNEPGGNVRLYLAKNGSDAAANNFIEYNSVNSGGALSVLLNGKEKLIKLR